MSKVEVNQISSQCGSTLTIGQSGDTVTLACGATQSGFGRTGTVDWDTTAKTSAFTAVSGNGYFVNTTSAAVTMTLPASPSAGDIVAFKDYAGTFATNNLTIGRNGSNLDGNAGDKAIDTDNTSMSLVYVDATQGWKSVEEGTGYLGENFIVATGGTVTTCSGFKIHTFTSPGTFSVSSLAGSPANNTVDYLVVAGGGGAAGNHGGAGGAGGLRYYLNTTNSPTPAFPGSPLNNFPSGTSVTVTATDFPVTVGGGGANGVATPGASSTTRGTPGSNSIFSTITSAGGGGGGGTQTTPSHDGISGGSGGGAGTPYPSGSSGTAGSGNTPPVTPAQGTNGGDARKGPGWISAGGGGGAIGIGGTSPAASCAPSATGLTVPAGLGGDGAGFTCNVFGSGNGECSSCVQYFAGGGGGGGSLNSPTTPTTVANPEGGLGGGGNGAGNCATPDIGKDGTTNVGGGGGGGSACANGGSGGSGIVIIRYKYQ
jgi:hypothetical protein